jgi:hypothetical protein
MNECIRAATQAPSAHNNQPWRFRAEGDVIRVELDHSRLLPALDPDRHQGCISIGAAVENLVLAARGRGWWAHVHLFPAGEEGRVADIRLEADGAPANSFEARLLTAVPERCTVRTAYAGEPLPEPLLQDCRDLVASGGGTLHLADSPEMIRLAAKLVGQGEALCMAHEPIQREVYRWMRFSDRESAVHRDGLWIRTFAVDPLTRRLSRRLLAWNTLRRLNRLGLHRAFGMKTERTVRRSSAVCLLTVPGKSLADYVQGGRLFQRLALFLTGEGVSCHPLSAVPVLTHLARQYPDTLSEGQRSEAERLQRELQACFPGSADETVVLLFRIGVPKSISVREPRRPVEEVREPGVSRPVFS